MSGRRPRSEYLVEYGLFFAVIAIIVIAVVMPSLGGGIVFKIQEVLTKLFGGF